MPKTPEKVITRQRKSETGRPIKWNDPVKKSTIMEKETAEAAEAMCFSLGTSMAPLLSNLLLSALIGGGYLTQRGTLTKKAVRLLEEKHNGVHSSSS